MAKSVQLEKARELLKASKRTVAEICEEGALPHAVAEMEKLRVPHALHAEAAAVSAAAAPLGAWAQELCLAELRSLQAEARMTQRFRAPGTLAVLRAGEQLLVDLLDLQPFVPAAASAVPRLLNELRAAVAEVEPLCAATAASFDELDEGRRVARQGGHGGQEQDGDLLPLAHAVAGQWSTSWPRPALHGALHRA